ncbi:GNAT family N-acetyltransferase [Tuwongella immobilis]|uniref:N-acetyltransferase domain-containing protein n=1 Tax=Tuwongella immobilis TaxID=692036 RepID=A0A6C2YL32_9BACT|nr:GNAT family protein [Tuwongella immobilis]VIP02136.1 gcn5 family n-acetyltransferase : Acetyltransferase (GNAT) domain protein OS=Bacteriovorax sp. BAL6_X GN=M902_0378 PE=4 SV=1: Acetyltransf_3 [Tuwongella immobilis]VTS00494.1 gcn5 family n-acetyltransferase : Acetyltransferase (GNAT) domain protein OS=Bacteriovorax sp. BAL6_X GN=M902_0378 PE=4 SV=1: Acetyltransf_3 [Tuwongella immobilis]
MKWSLPGNSWNPPQLQTARLTIRPLVPNDAEAIFAFCSDSRMTEYTLWETHQSIADTMQFLREYAPSRYREQIPEPLGIVLRNDHSDSVIGTLGGFWISKSNGTMELGYAIAANFWGLGFATEASQALIDYLFTDYPIERLQARSMTPNRASYRVLEKLGFRYEGTMRSLIYRRGRYWDVGIFGMLRADWESSRRTRT